jgi:membrane protease YdiL (CAAX protease family)
MSNLQTPIDSRTQLHEISANNSPKPTVLRRIFFGADGLRAGWALALYMALISLLQYLVVSAFHHYHRLDPDQLRRLVKYPSQLLITCGIPFAVVAIGNAFLARVERRSISAYGIGPTPGALRQFGAGIFWGTALLSLLAGTLWSLHLLVFDGIALSGFAIVRYAAEWAVGFLCVALFEESVTRGFIFFTLARGIAGPLRYTKAAPYERAIGFWAVAAFFSWQFGYAHSHNAGESLVGVATAGLLGAIFCLSLWRTGSLWWAIGFHASWDWAQSYLFGVADSGHVVEFHLLQSHPQGAVILSGGPTGPEGSIYVIPVFALSALVVLLTQRQTHWPAPGSNLAPEKLKHAHVS